ncbi:hypothetical protein [Microbacterium sp. KSW4-4]|uniref:hypothetical protein n=1 Tax=Microbacterium sp. KSW4-4 TaxID=2851651 RepID=UPI001FFC8F4F|nr:hypothetical protein [Microbacterium sp. KSW4-4]MCK2032628.1 hypothetical protein [Microbacterium sp. KSW4-4]
MTDFLPAVALVLVTALSTGGVTLASTWQQSKIADRRRTREREDALADIHASNSRDHALRLHDALVDLHELGRAENRAGRELPSGEAIRPFSSVAGRTYLLIEDADVRRVVADGLTIVSSPHSRDVTPADWRDATATTSFIVAAYLRGEQPPARYALRLAELRRQYPLPDSNGAITHQ